MCEPDPRHIPARGGRPGQGTPQRTAGCRVRAASRERSHRPAPPPHAPVSGSSGTRPRGHTCSPAASTGRITGRAARAAINWHTSASRLCRAGLPAPARHSSSEHAMPQTWLHACPELPPPAQVAGVPPLGNGDFERRHGTRVGWMCGTASDACPGEPPRRIRASRACRWSGSERPRIPLRWPNL